MRISVGESRRYRFSPIGKLDQCKTLCGKIEKGRMATMRSTREIDHLLSHVDEILFPDGKPSRAGTITPAIWAPSSKISKGKFRGPMIYYELRGRFPSSVFAEDGFCCHSMLGIIRQFSFDRTGSCCEGCQAAAFEGRVFFALCSEPVHPPIQLYM